MAGRKSRKQQQEEAAAAQKLQTEETLSKLFEYKKKMEQSVARLESVTQRIQGAVK